MRTETEVQTELLSMRTEYNALAHTAPAPTLQALSSKIRAAANELSAIYSEGANACPKCKAPVMGMLRTPAGMSGDRPTAAVYQVGCSGCKPEIIDVDGTPRRRSYCAFGGSPAEAVKNWNDGKFIVDGRIGDGPKLTVGRAV